MNIFIEARSLTAKSGGVKTYTHELISNLIALHPDSHFELLYSSNNPVGTFPSATEIVTPLHLEALLPFWMRTVAEQVRSKNPDIVHYTKAAIPKDRTIPTVVTIYDIIPILFPQTQSPLRRLYWNSALRYAATNADHIITISERSKRDLIQHLGVKEERIAVTQLAVDLAHFTPLRYEPDIPYILFVGTRDPRKNIASLIRAYALIAHSIPHKLIIAGKSANKDDNAKQITSDLHLESRIEFREHVSYADLPALYSGADVFVWPSIYEGWGFPPQEAMACGTPVIVSDGGPLPEVVGDAGVIVPLQEEMFIERLSKEIAALLQDDARKQDLSKRGLVRVRNYSWVDVAKKTWEVYEKVIS